MQRLTRRFVIFRGLGSDWFLLLLPDVHESQRELGGPETAWEHPQIVLVVRHAHKLHVQSLSAAAATKTKASDSFKPHGRKE